MSGHSKWSTIKHKKEATDAARGKLFSKLSRAILIAVKTGGGEDPAVNNKLRMAIEAAKSANMPKVNIEKAVSRG
ncbi:MAG: YebC/PmpR family DNA-binding transcriptional regulator, partial [Patescibacteria group bacterium]